VFLMMGEVISVTVDVLQVAPLSRNPMMQRVQYFFTIVSKSASVLHGCKI